MAQLLNYKFSKLGDYKGSACNFFPTKHRTSKNSFDFRFVTTKEVLLTLKKLNSNKPSGPSDIPSWALKHGFLFLADPIKLLFNQFLAEEKFPEDLKKAIVTPIFKKGENSLPENYRPILFTSSLAKVFERLLREQTLEYLEKFGLLSNTQFGFRNKVSTIDALVYCTETIRYHINNNNFITAALLDLSKAFDSTNHKILLQKLHELGFSKNALNLIESYLSHRLQKTIVNHTKVYQGVPQGTILGPLLFNLYINDLNKQIPANTGIIQYADDTIILTYNTDLKLATYNLEQSLKNISEYYEKHRLMLNHSKTEFNTFSKNQN